MVDQSSRVEDQTLQTDVLVIGAGPTGLFAAVLLARHNVSVRVIDASPGPAKESRAMVLQARSLELLLAMGLAEAALDKGVIVTGAEFLVDGQSAVQIGFEDIGRVDTPYPFPLILPQSDTEAILLADLEQRGVTVEYGTRATGLEQSPDKVSVAIEHPTRGSETVSARYVLGADGAHSMVRKALGLSFEGAAYRQNFLLADCAIHWGLKPGQLRIFLRGTGLAAVFPMRGSLQGRIIVVEGEEGATTEPVEQQGSREVALPEVEAAFRAVTGLDVTLSDPVWTSRYRVHHRGVDRYGVDRVFVAGDAAHIHSPAGGQGMNTGLQDAANLAWKLAAVIKGGAPAGLLDSYHAERWPVGRKILDRTDRMFAGMTTSNRLAAQVRNVVLPVIGGAVMRSQTMRARAFHFISELGIRYHTGPFVTDAVSPTRQSASLQAGYRAPDGRIDRTHSVFDMLDASRFVLLALSWMPLDDQAIGTLTAELASVPKTVAAIPLDTHLIARTLVGRDSRLMQAESNEVFTAYGVAPEAPQALFLVRPDGYIAFRADGFAVERLKGFLSRFSRQA